MTSSVAERTVTAAGLSVRFRPETGARIVSVRDARAGREWLVPPHAERPRSYGASYTGDRLVYGWDEMVPTIDECTAGGVPLPDHGELWAIPWSERPPLRPDGVRFAAACRRAPLTLEREAAADGESIVLDYLLRNHGPRPFPAYWAAHPFFAVSAAARVEFPVAVGTAVIDLPAAGRGEAAWSEIERRAARLTEGEFLKARLPSDAICAATVVDGPAALEVSWTGAAVRHLALVWDNRTFASTRALAVEPRIADGDTPLAAGGLVLDAGAEVSWTLRLRSARHPLR